MGKALVLKGTNFYANRLGTVTFNDIPCTGISLSNSTATVTTSTTLTATVTPANTTDSVTWESSNTNVATVNNGVVTAVSNGTATITATCGQYSATCAVTVAIPLKADKTGFIRIRAVSAHVMKDFSEFLATSNAIAIGAQNGTYPAYGEKAASSDLKSLYPIPIPTGAKSLNLVIGENYAPCMVWFNASEKSVDAQESSYYDDCAKVLDGQTPGGGTDWSISAWSYGEQTIQIPEITGINGFTLSLSCANSNAYNNFDLSNISFTFGFE